MNIETRTFIYGFFMLFAGSIILYAGVNSINEWYYKWGGILIGIYAIFIGSTNIHKTILK